MLTAKNIIRFIIITNILTFCIAAYINHALPYGTLSSSHEELLLIAAVIIAWIPASLLIGITIIIYITNFLKFLIKGSSFTEILTTKAFLNLLLGHRKTDTT